MNSTSNHLQDQLLEQKKYKTRFISTLSDTYVFTSTEEILYFHVGLAGTYFITKGKKKFYVNYKLKELEQILDPSKFFRVNRSYIVHIMAIEKIIKFSNRRLKVLVTNSEDENILISREKVSKFKTWIDL